MNQKPSFLRSLSIMLITILAVVIYAYGFQVTQIDFQETRSKDRLLVLTRILRALAHPDILEYDYEETNVDTLFYLPCPEGETPAIPEPDRSGAFITTNISCASPKDTITVNGYNFQRNSAGPIYFIYASGANKQLENFKADADGNFQVEVELPVREPVAEAQTIRATGRVRVGSPHWSTSAITTWEKIVETVFLALLATTVGTILSIPISFIAARNLMSEVKSPLSNLSLSLLGWPLGILVGIIVTVLLRGLLMPYFTNNLINLTALVALPLAGYFLMKWALTLDDDGTFTRKERFLYLIVQITVGLLSLVFLILISQLLLQWGQAIAPKLGSLDFLGTFVYQWGDIIQMITPLVTALFLGAVFGGLFGKAGQLVSDRATPGIVRLFNLIITPISFAALFMIIMQGINWFYQFNNPAVTYWWPGGLGLVAGLALAIWRSPEEPMPTGMIMYSITRTLLNVTRSVEPLIMGIVFVAWVGLGPFAGALALGLHTIASLSKLYSEQVESILPGPLEAVTATGANRLQTIVYAVVPQIIPPYISFTMYRWDINVRMSTIIGFVGGGGIGFVLQQNINLLNYRAASANMLAIAIVVASMDYISSSLRERFV